MSQEDESYSEPVAFFYHNERGERLAETAFNIAADVYQLQACKFFRKDYAMVYFSLLDEKAQKHQRDHLFTNSVGLIRTLLGFKQNEISEASGKGKASSEILNEALSQIESIS